MAQRLVKGIDDIFDVVTVFAIISGGMIFHLVTAFAVKAAHGPVWGVAAFVLPGAAELGYAVNQLGEGNLKYPVLLLLYVAIVAVKLIFLWGKNLLLSKIRNRYSPLEQI